MTPPSPLLVIAGSVRARRLCLSIADWVAGLGREATARPIEVVDLRDWPLPMDDEPGIPALGVYDLDHTRSWSRKIAGAAGFVFVTPQYNWGYPAALKNALDHLHREWSGKPATILAYGGHGGDKCAAQLAQVCAGLRMAPVAIGPGLVLPRALIEANTGEIDPAAVFADQAEAVRAAVASLAAALDTGAAGTTD